MKHSTGKFCWIEMNNVVH